MSEWLHEHYISRDEHQRIVDYYRKLVAQLYCKVRESRSQAEALDEHAAHGRGTAEPEKRRLTEAPSTEFGGNVIRVDFRNRA